MKLPRLIHHIYADLFGYFWASCPICGDMWGGHEWGDGQTLYDSWHSGTGVCPNCKEKVKILNDKFFDENPQQPRIIYQEA